MWACFENIEILNLVARVAVKLEHPVLYTVHWLQAPISQPAGPCDVYAVLHYDMTWHQQCDTLVHVCIYSISFRTE
jgi:hypothetical protein